jgi:hypothetical protein
MPKKTAYFHSMLFQNSINKQNTAKECPCKNACPVVWPTINRTVFTKSQNQRELRAHFGIGKLKSEEFY